MSPRTQKILRVVIPVLVLVAGLIATRAVGDETTSDPSVATTDTSLPVTDTTNPPSTSPTGACVTDDVATVSVADLPAEAVTTLELIASDGPFPYDQDGATFQNREGNLPDQNRGYYHEYTVETPGSDDRGARRIVVGECGDRWYTDDHYDSFALIEGDP